MRLLPVRARALVLAVAGAAVAIFAWALIQVAKGTSGPATGSADAGRVTLLELGLIAVMMICVRLLVISSADRPKRNYVLSGVVVTVGVGLIALAQHLYGLANRDYSDSAYYTVHGEYPPGSHDLGLIFLVVLALVTLSAAASSSFSVGDGGFTVDQVLPVLIASYLIAGTAGGVIVAGLLALASQVGEERVKTIFNSSVKVISVWAAGIVFYLPARGSSSAVQLSWLVSPHLNDPLVLVLAVLLANFVFVTVNFSLVGAIVSFTSEISWIRATLGIARNVGAPLILNSALGLILAIVYVHSGVGPLAMVLVLLPLFAARWVFAQIAGERSAQEATLAALIKAVETKDWYTKGHSERVAVAALQIGASLQLDADLMRELRFAGMLHDIGKLGVPTGVLIKPGRLDEAEFDAIKRHPVLGQEVVRGIEFLDEAKRGIYYHHERIDGRGYPEGLKGDEIPLFARILGVADAFDSMTQVRSYRGARSVEAALDELDAHRGTQFDTDMVDALMAALDAGWQPETPPVVEQPNDARGVPALGVDDDDPSAAAALASHRPRRADAP